MDRESFKLYVISWAEKIGVSEKIKEIHIRNMRRKLASCSSRGRLTFDSSILEKSPEEIDYVIIHELLHLRYPNHGKMFKVMLNLYLNSDSLHNFQTFE